VDDDINSDEDDYEGYDDPEEDEIVSKPIKKASVAESDAAEEESEIEEDMSSTEWRHIKVVSEDDVQDADEDMEAGEDEMDENMEEEEAESSEQETNHKEILAK